MTELGQTLLANIQKTFLGRLKTDRKLKTITRRIRDGTRYEIANDYAVRTGELLSESVRANTRTLAYMSEEVAREVLPPLLEADHELVATVSKQIQRNINKQAGVGLTALVADLDTNRIDGLISKVSSYETFDDARWVLGEPLINYSMAVVDQTIRKNFDASTKAGLRPKIVRETEAHETVTRNRVIHGKTYSYTYEVPCEWCKNLAGTYDYADVRNTGNDVYRRHEGCRCTITYIQGNRAQDVVSKAEWEAGDAEGRRRAITELTEKRAREAAETQRQREIRLGAIERLQRELGYSAKAASILYNSQRAFIQKYGLQTLIDETRATNPYARQA